MTQQEHNFEVSQPEAAAPPTRALEGEVPAKQASPLGDAKLEPSRQHDERQASEAQPVQAPAVEDSALGSYEQLGAPAPPPSRRAYRRDLLAILVAALGWFVPGAGYLLLRRWSRALIGFAAVGTLALIGFAMRGNVFPPHGSEPFDFLGFLADLGSGLFYFLARTVEASGPDVSRAAGDYGTRLIATAGVLNLLLILDAVEIARGEKA